MAGERYAKLELEDAPGSEGNPNPAVFATPFYLPAIEAGITPNPQPLDRSDEQRGIDGRTTVAPNEYEPEGGITMRSYTHYIGALLMMLFGDVDSVEGDGVAVEDPEGNPVEEGAYMHTFKKKPGALPKTARLTIAYATRWVRANGVTVPSMGFTLDEDGVKAECSLMANYLQRLSVDPANAPDYEDFAVLPFRRRNVAVDIDNGGTVNLEGIEYTMEQSLQYVRDLGSRTGWPSDTERENSPEGFLRLTGSMTRRDFDAADWDDLISAGAFSLAVSMVSEQNIPTTTQPYAMYTVTDNAQFIGGGPENLKNQARHEASYDWAAGSNEPGQADFSVVLINDVPAYKA